MSDVSVLVITIILLCPASLSGHQLGTGPQLSAQLIHIFLLLLGKQNCEYFTFIWVILFHLLNTLILV